MPNTERQTPNAKQPIREDLNHLGSQNTHKVLGTMLVKFLILVEFLVIQMTLASTVLYLLHK